jgi:hypothetical protein
MPARPPQPEPAARRTAPRPPPSNAEIAHLLERVAELLERQQAGAFRVNAYRAAARSVREWPVPVADVDRAGGREALEAIPGIGRTLSAHLREILQTGGLTLLDRLSGQVAPEDLFTTLPGVGDTLARRFHEELGAETLEELEVAAWDGRLAAVRGVGPRRAQALAAALDQALRARSRRPLRPLPTRAAGARPPVSLLLDCDERYRAEARDGHLRRIAPRRFNPRGEAWLPVLHAELDGWSVTALFSNSGRAHALGRTRDWVVIHAERDGEEDSCTVVTETSGALAGRRVVRGREEECARHYGSGAGVRAPE